MRFKDHWLAPIPLPCQKFVAQSTQKTVYQINVTTLVAQIPGKVNSNKIQLMFSFLTQSSSKGSAKLRRMLNKSH
jgi:hypothetical protein